MRLSTLGLYNADSTIFNDLQLPEGIDPADLRDMILYSTAELEVLYPEPGTFKTVLRVWSNARKPAWARMLAALTEEYNPLHNYDRHEEWTEGKESSGESGGTTDTRVAGFNDNNSLAPQGQTESSGEFSAGETTEREGHLYGNIGVTTSAQMLSGELEVRKSDIYHIITEEYKRAFCLLVY